MEVRKASSIQLWETRSVMEDSIKVASVFVKGLVNASLPPIINPNRYEAQVSEAFATWTWHLQCIDLGLYRTLIDLQLESIP